MGPRLQGSGAQRCCRHAEHSDTQMAMWAWWELTKSLFYVVRPSVHVSVKVDYWKKKSSVWVYIPAFLTTGVTSRFAQASSFTRPNSLVRQALKQKGIRRYSRGEAFENPHLQMMGFDSGPRGRIQALSVVFIAASSFFWVWALINCFQKGFDLGTYKVRYRKGDCYCHTQVLTALCSVWISKVVLWQAFVSLKFCENLASCSTYFHHSFARLTHCQLAPNCRRFQFHYDLGSRHIWVSRAADTSLRSMNVLLLGHCLPISSHIAVFVINIFLAFLEIERHGYLL